jgi:hypothetical protein
LLGDVVVAFSRRINDMERRELEGLAAQMGKRIGQPTSL